MDDIVASTLTHEKLQECPVPVYTVATHYHASPDSEEDSAEAYENCVLSLYDALDDWLMTLRTSLFPWGIPSTGAQPGPQKKSKRYAHVISLFNYPISWWPVLVSARQAQPTARRVRDPKSSSFPLSSCAYN